jgi:hypothetical protein
VAGRKRSAKPRDEDFRGDSQQEPKLMRNETEVPVPVKANLPTANRSSKMPVIDMSSWEDFSNIPELTILPEGSEVKLRILEVIGGVNTNGEDYIRLRLDVVGEPLVKEVSYPISFPSPANKAKLSEKRFYYSQREWGLMLKAFEISGSQLDTSDWPGKEAWAMLGVQSDKTGRYPDQNIVRRWQSAGNDNGSRPAAVGAKRPTVDGDDEIPF